MMQELRNKILGAMEASQFNFAEVRNGELVVKNVVRHEGGDEKASERMLNLARRRAKMSWTEAQKEWRAENRRQEKIQAAEDLAAVIKFGHYARKNSWVKAQEELKRAKARFYKGGGIAEAHAVQTAKATMKQLKGTAEAAMKAARAAKKAAQDAFRILMDGFGNVRVADYSNLAEVAGIVSNLANISVSAAEVGAAVGACGGLR
jgi:ribosomal protein L24E